MKLDSQAHCMQLVVILLEKMAHWVEKLEQVGRIRRRRGRSEIHLSQCNSTIIIEI